MKIRTLLAVAIAIAVAATAQVFTHAQLNRTTPNVPASVPNFSLPQNAGLPINTTEGDTGPFIAPSGLSLYFASGRDGGLGDLDIVVSQRTTPTSPWGDPVNLGAIVNSIANDNQPSLSPDGLTLFFNSGRDGGFGGADLYMSTRTDVNNDLGWTVPVNVGPQVNTASGEISAMYFVDQGSDSAEILYFASNRSGNIDIYQSVRSPNGTFRAATNVALLNSTGNDEGPSISRNGLEMLFSSDRPGGNSGRDIWVSTRPTVTSPWGAPVNLTMINSEWDETNPAHSYDGSVLYFVSDRTGTVGLTDIYSSHRLCAGN